MEPFPAFLTLMRFLTTLSTLRFRNVRTTAKGTFLTFTAAFAFVQSLVHSQVCPTATDSPALCTLGAFLLTVHLLVCSETRPAHERFLTCLTFMGFFSRVSFSMGCALEGTRPPDRGHHSLFQMSLLMVLLHLQLACDLSVTSGPAVLKAGLCTVFCRLLLQ